MTIYVILKLSLKPLLTTIVQGRAIAVSSSAVGLTLNALLITAIGNLQNSTEQEKGVNWRACFLRSKCFDLHAFCFCM